MQQPEAATQFVPLIIAIIAIIAILRYLGLNLPRTLKVVERNLQPAPGAAATQACLVGQNAAGPRGNCECADSP
jgi:hypothetical protein